MAKKTYFDKYKRSGKVQLHTWIQGDLHIKLKQYALDNGLTVQQAVDKILNLFLGETDKKDPWTSNF